jgi:hypothetical protein
MVKIAEIGKSGKWNPLAATMGAKINNYGE